MTDSLLALGSVLAMVLSVVLTGFVVSFTWWFAVAFVRRINEWRAESEPVNRMIHLLPEGFPGCDLCARVAQLARDGVMEVLDPESDLYTCPSCHAKILAATAIWQERARKMGIDLEDLRGD